MDASFSLPTYTADPEQNPEVEVYQLIAKLEGLEPGSVVYYRVTSQDGAETQVGKRYFFKTAPEKGERFNFVLLSDMQQRVKTKETMKVIGQQQADFYLFAGDLVNVPWKVGEWFDYEGCYQEPGEEDRTFFECLSQDGDNSRLMQYAPIFFAPGNHEIDDQRYMLDTDIANDMDHYSWSVYLQMFRPLYPEQDYGVNGKRWYSADYGDLHIDSIAVHRSYFWDGFDAPGWHTFSDISPDSAQVKWLQQDLSQSDSKYKWVVMHWHMLNRGDDGHVPVSGPVIDPADPTKATYPNGDYCWDVLRPLYEQYGVNAVNFGHSHVYERYLINDVNYIEAASIGNNYRATNDPYHPSGNLPVVELNNFRSYMVVNVDETGMHAKGEEADAFNHLNAALDKDKLFEVGDAALASLSFKNGTLAGATLIDHYRLDRQALLFGLFGLLLILFGGISGFGALLSLVASVLIVWKILIPLVLLGYSPIWCAFAVVVLLTVMIDCLVAGLSRTSFVAIAGSLLGTAFTCALSVLFGNMLKLDGSSLPYVVPIIAQNNMRLNLREIFFSMVFIANSGALMDLSMDIASACEEIVLHRPDIERKQLLKSGFSVGRNVIGTMTTTLMLAYSGSYLSLLMYFQGQGTPIIDILNLKYVSSEVLTTLVGSFGLVTVAPFTAMVASIFTSNVHDDKGLEHIHKHGSMQDSV